MIIRNKKSSKYIICFLSEAFHISNINIFLNTSTNLII